MDKEPCILCGKEQDEFEQIFFPALEGMPYMCEKCIESMTNIALAFLTSGRTTK